MKKMKLLYYLIIAFVWGYIFTAMVYNGMWSNFLMGLRALNWWIYPLGFLASFILSLSIHELGHFFAFLFQGVKLRALYILIFVFYKSARGWRITVRPKLWVLLGGLVVPDIDDITDEKRYDETIKKFANALIAAPIVTIVYMLLSIVIMAVILYVGTNPISYGLSSLWALSTLILSVVYVWSFKLSNPMFYGDFVAYEKMKKDPVFQLAQLTQYTMFALKPSEDTDRFLWEKVKDTLKKVSFHRNMAHMMLLMQYIEGVVSQDYPFDLQVDIKINRMPTHPYYQSEQGIMLLYDVCHYHYKLNRPDKAFALFFQIQERASKKINQESLEYLKRRSMHVMHMEDQTQYLDDPSHLKMGNTWIFDPIIDTHAWLKQAHEKLPFVIYKTDVHLIEEKALETAQKESDPS